MQSIFREIWWHDVSSYKWKMKDKIYQRKGHNVVPLWVRTSLASVIAWNTVSTSFQANYIALGADATPANENDTQLWNETLRAEFTDRRHIANVAFLDKFFSSTEVGWNQYNEVWLFIDGTATPNSGVLLSRININENMQALESLTINATITIA